MKEVFEEITVQLAPSGFPLFVRWGRRTLRALNVLDAWRWGGEWWQGGWPRDYYLVRFTFLVAEVYREDRRARLPGFEPGEEALWVLARIAD